MESRGEAPNVTTARFELQEDMEVFSADGKKLGSVKEARPSDFLVNRALRRDLYVPLEAVATVAGGRVRLNVSADAVDDLGWAEPELAEAPGPTDATMSNESEYEHRLGQVPKGSGSVISGS